LLRSDANSFIVFKKILNILYPNVPNQIARYNFDCQQKMNPDQAFASHGVKLEGIYYECLDPDMRELIQLWKSFGTESWVNLKLTKRAIELLDLLGGRFSNCS
jgi:hypothetical protein